MIYSLRADFGLQRADFGPKTAYFGSERENFEPERANLEPERGDSRSETVDLDLLGLIAGLKEPDLGLRGRGVWTDRRTDIRKFTRLLQDIGP